MFAAIWKGFCTLSRLIGYAASAAMLYFVVTGLLFPFIYGANEIIASIVRFAIAYGLFHVADFLEAITPAPPVALRLHPALIDEDDSRSRAARDAAIADASLVHMHQQEQAQHLAWWINHNRG